MKFKPGDLVHCVRTYNDEVRAGKNYVISANASYDSDLVHLRGFGDMVFDEERFRHHIRNYIALCTHQSKATT